MFQFVKIAVRNIIKNRTRSIILGVSIMVTTIILTVLMAFSSGVEHTMLKNSTILLTGHVNVSGFYKISQSSAAPVITDLKRLNQIVKDNVPEAVVVLDRIKAWGKIISDSSSLQYPMWGIDMVSEKEIKGTLVAADEAKYGLSDFSKMEDRGNITVFETHADKLDLKVGDSVTISMPTYRNTNNTMDLNVVAVLKDIGFLSQFSIMAHKDDLREIYRMNDNSSGQIMIYLNSLKDVPAVENRLRSVFEQEGYRILEKESVPFWAKFDKVTNQTWTGQKLDITTWEDEISFMKWIILTIRGLSIGLVMVLLLIIVLGITNTIWMSIKERTNEIGTLRAIGMHGSKIIKMFVLEAFILSSISTILGLAIACALCSFMNWLNIPISSVAFRVIVMSDQLNFLVSFNQLILSFLIITFFTTIGALLPAYRASKMKPITAINYIN
jgi:putative ABC transport system permease protein